MNYMLLTPEGSMAIVVDTVMYDVADASQKFPEITNELVAAGQFHSGGKIVGNHYYVGEPEFECKVKLQSDYPEQYVVDDVANSAQPFGIEFVNRQFNWCTLRGYTEKGVDEFAKWAEVMRPAWTVKVGKDEPVQALPTQEPPKVETLPTAKPEPSKVEIPDTIVAVEVAPAPQKVEVQAHPTVDVLPTPEPPQLVENKPTFAPPPKPVPDVKPIKTITESQPSKNKPVSGYIPNMFTWGHVEKEEEPEKEEEEPPRQAEQKEPEPKQVEVKQAVVSRTAEELEGPEVPAEEPEVATEPEVEAEQEPKQVVEPEPELEVETENEPELEVDKESGPESEQEPEQEVEPESEAESEPEVETTPEVNPESDTESEVEQEPEVPQATIEPEPEVPQRPTPAEAVLDEEKIQQTVITPEMTTVEDAEMFLIKAAREEKPVTTVIAVPEECKGETWAQTWKHCRPKDVTDDAFCIEHNWEKRESYYIVDCVMTGKRLIHSDKLGVNAEFPIRQCR